MSKKTQRSLFLVSAILENTLIDTDRKALLKGLRHPWEFSEFVRWTALPEPLREPKTQKKLADVYGVGADVISDWKKRNGFWNEVRAHLKDFGKERTPDVLYGLFRKAREGNAAEVKLWLQYFETFSEKSPVDTEIRQFILVRGEPEGISANAGVSATRL